MKNAIFSLILENKIVFSMVSSFPSFGFKPLLIDFQLYVTRLRYVLNSSEI